MLALILILAVTAANGVSVIDACWRCEALPVCDDLLGMLVISRRVELELMLMKHSRLQLLDQISQVERLEGEDPLYGTQPSGP